MKTSCFLVPVHPPKFDFAERLLESYAEYFDDDHVFLVFTNGDDCKAFEQKYPELKYQSIICGLDIINGTNVINVKKLYGIKWIFDNTEFLQIGVIDADSLFFRYMDYNQKFVNYLLNRKIYGHTVDKNGFMSSNIESCVRYFDDKYKGFIEKETRNYNVFFWFNDVPVYQKQSFLEFCEYVKMEKIYRDIKWHDFDYIFYAYFLMVKGYMNLEVLNYHIPFSDGSFIELQKRIPVDLFREHYNIMNPMWIFDPIDTVDMKNTFMLVHIDR